MQMFSADMVKTAHNRSAKQTPHIFDRVAMDAVFCDIPHVMVNFSMSLCHASNFAVSREFIGVKLSLFQVQPIIKRIGDLSLRQPWNVGSPDLPAITLHGTKDGRFLLGASPASQRALFFWTRVAAVIVVIDLHDTVEQFRWRMIFSHGFSDAMAQMPATLLADSKLSLHFKGRNRFLGVQNDKDSDKPLSQPDMCVVEDRAGRGREAVSTAKTRPLLSFGQFACAIAFAARACNAIVPPNADKVLAARLVIGKLFNQLNQIHGTGLFSGAGSARIAVAKGIRANRPDCLAPSRLQPRRGFFHCYNCSHVYLSSQ